MDERKKTVDRDGLEKERRVAADGIFNNVKARQAYRLINGTRRGAFAPRRFSKYHRSNIRHCHFERYDARRRRGRARA